MKSLITCAVFLMLSWIVSGAPLLADTLVLDDFESKSCLKKWSGPVSLASEFSTHGKRSLRIKLVNGSGNVVQSESLPRDWSGYDRLLFDIYNATGRVQVGSIELYDALGSDEEAHIRGEAYLGSRKLFLNRGWNHVEFLLNKAWVTRGTRPLQLSKVRRFRLKFRGVRGVLYLDNLRLVAGKEGEDTVSRSDPRDCRVLIDNRFVYPSLMGPLDRIKESPEIVDLRLRAESEVDKLKREVELAKLQGLQTLYWEIPLVTADVGMGIRSKLVWFQNDEEQEKILRYVIDSCRAARVEIDSILSAQKRLKEPDDSSIPLPTVPPYPRFRGLKQRDGYFRDHNGDPLIIFAMNYHTRGRLLDFFATFDHRLESYSVGGGSRYDIESSPVYEAFHKYPDTHRVGWDGWCGHLIKDAWAMGGKKEDVVICLESPHIREAVVKYIRQHHRDWSANPDLLYNIMAYELMYICYCDRSQQMFRRWLEDKYGSIDSLNEIWGTSYKSFTAVMAPPTRNARPLPDVNRAAWYDWADFNTRRFTDYLKWVKSEIRKLDPDIPICAGGTSSMLSSNNSVTGIDEELIINEVDDVILNESGSSPIFSDLLLSLSRKKKAMVDPEMGGGVHGILLQFLHGKSAIAKWWWPKQPNPEFPYLSATSVAHSWDIPLSDVAEVLRLALDVRRLRREIAEFSRPEPEIAIFYSKTCMLQVPPNLVQAGRTPYLDALFSLWEGSRFLGCRVGFISEKQILAGKLEDYKLLLVPAAKYVKQDVMDKILEYLQAGGVAVVVPESFLFDEYARERDRVRDLGITIKGVTIPPILGKGELVQNYDQSFSQKVIFGEIRRTIKVENRDIFRECNRPLQSRGLVQAVDAGKNKVLARFENGSPAVVLVKKGRGRLYYLAAPLVTEDYGEILVPLADELRLKRPIIGVDESGKLVTGVEVRGVERDRDILVYACNLQGKPVEFDLKSDGEIGTVTDLRSLRIVPGAHVRLKPYQETILRVDKVAIR